MIIDMQSQLGMLAAPVACIDRRSLSQAWYSALYGEGRAKPQASPSVRSADWRPSVVQHGRAPAAATIHELHRSRPVKGRPRHNAPLRVAGERRALPTTLARRIERTLRRAPGISRASLCVDAGGARVHLLIRTNGSGLHVVAICSAKVQRDVSAALLQARFALARRGIALHTSTQEHA